VGTGSVGVSSTGRATTNIIADNGRDSTFNTPGAGLTGKTEDVNHNLIRGLIAAYASLSLGYDLYAAHVQVPMGFVVLGARTQIVGGAILGLIVRELP